MATPTSASNPVIEASNGGEDPVQSSRPALRRQSCVDSAAEFHSPGSLQEELRKARLYRGRLRSQLRDTTEQLNNLIVSSEDDVQVHDVLADREKDLRLALEEQGAYVVALELRYDELTEKNSQILGQSKTLPSVVGALPSELPNHTPSLNGHHLLNDARLSNTHSCVSSGRDSEISESYFLGSTCQPTLATPAPYQQAVPRPEAFVMTTGAPVPTRVSGQDVRPVDSVSNVGVPPRMSIPKKCDSAAIGKLAIQSLRKSHQFSQHVLRIEEVLHEAGGGFYDENGAFQPHYWLRHACIQKFLTTLNQCPEVMDTASGTYDVRGDNWSAIKEACISAYGRRSVLVEKLNFIVSGLRFKSVRDIESYLKDVIAACEIYRVVYSTGSTDAQLIQFMRQILSKLPREIVQGVIRRCKDRLGTLEGDWECAVPVHSSGSSTPLNDSVKAIQADETSKSKSDGGGKSGVKSAFKEFLGRHRAVFGVTGYGCKNKDENREVGLANVSSLPVPKFRAWEVEDYSKKNGNRNANGGVLNGDPKVVSKEGDKPSQGN
ncbi:hypothetical protein Pmar_PMAR000667 [Perkinsus marinus ATCC 50983]|uniref:Uncharacterized protein n=1 Tax=Perkinsus marinus (strain ATCC 50983 / TXsc) TaxID=423536 RepID=C5KRF8_PERM5|nr:hypothetical protein Pmar_PMAR000667 [Perkinsus marinus ATCC 50983]EER12931.1 hypothetical protein Pmar_PMAR000667 [Perkinsus marinus ATCC 50983]|eukprot:XP_002781136.1 hypothetical protein Pmar_PMAR000667 [Perkinsus marinus ATCC 50983]